MNVLQKTPWIALQCAMIQIQGNIGLVSMKDGFDVQCHKCRNISQPNVSDANQSMEGVACMHCLRGKGQIRLVLKRESGSIGHTFSHDD